MQRRELRADAAALGGALTRSLAMGAVWEKAWGFMGWGGGGTLVLPLGDSFGPLVILFFLVFFVELVFLVMFGN